jgi:hypothetical protein
MFLLPVHAKNQTSGITYVDVILQCWLMKVKVCSTSQFVVMHPPQRCKNEFLSATGRQMATRVVREVRVVRVAQHSHPCCWLLLLGDITGSRQAASVE